MSQKNPYDKASRYAVNLDPVGFLRYFLTAGLTFRGWLNARTLTFPGQPDRTCDTVAHLIDDSGREWAVPLEFQLRPDPEMFGRFLGYLGLLWLEVRAGGSDNRYAVAAALVNLTGVGTTSRDMRWPKARLRSCLQVREINLAGLLARAVLGKIARGKAPRCMLPWIPLMTGGDEPAIMARWRELAVAESDARKRSDYGALAVVFAEAAGRRAAWKTALEGWNMEQSQQVLEWMNEATVREARRQLLHLLELKFTTVPTDLADRIRATTDVSELDRWFEASYSARSLKQVRQMIGV
jgi:hypothetical protein